MDTGKEWMENKEWHLFGSEMVCRTSVHHTRIKYQTKIGLPQLEDSFPVKYLALAMATQKATILLQFGSRVVAVNSPRLSLLSAAQIPHLLNRLHDMVIDTPSAFNCTWVPLGLGWNLWTWLICECPGNYSHQAPWPRSENWVEPGLRHRQHPCWNMAAGLQMCLREDRLHIRASSYSPPGQASGCSTNHSRLAQANTILRLSRLSTSCWGYQILGTTLTWWH